MRASREERFFHHVDKRADGCWIWTGTKDRAGYGRFTVTTHTRMLAHRWSYEHFVGPIPPGLTIDHIECDTPSCVNPAHLVPATQRDNILRGAGVAAVNARKETCPLGHLYDETNTYRRPDGGRDCKTCINRRSRERNERRRAG